MSSAAISTGDAELDDVLEDEAELKTRMGDLLDESDLATVVAFLVPWLDNEAVSTATWQFQRLIDEESEAKDSRNDSEAPAVPLAELIARHADAVDDAEVVELLVEAIDGGTTRRILSALDKKRQRR